MKQGSGGIEWGARVAKNDASDSAFAASILINVNANKMARVKFCSDHGIDALDKMKSSFVANLLSLEEAEHFGFYPINFQIDEIIKMVDDITFKLPEFICDFDCNDNSRYTVRHIEFVRDLYCLPGFEFTLLAFLESRISSHYPELNVSGVDGLGKCRGFRSELDRGGALSVYRKDRGAVRLEVRYNRDFFKAMKSRRATRDEWRVLNLKGTIEKARLLADQYFNDLLLPDERNLQVLHPLDALFKIFGAVRHQVLEDVVTSLVNSSGLVSVRGQGKHLRAAFKRLDTDGVVICVSRSVYRLTPQYRSILVFAANTRIKNRDTSVDGLDPGAEVAF